MQDLESIWRKPIYLPYLQPKLTDDILKDAEEKLGYQLPKELIELLRIQNGGYIRKSLEESMNTQIYGIGPHFPSLTDLDWSDYEGTVNFTLEGLIPFDGDGHWYLCLDYRINKMNPQITYIDTECDHQRTIAESFSDYLSQLVLEVEDELVIDTDKNLEQIAKELEQVLNVKFEEPSDYAHGYIQYTGQLYSSWVWLSPNLVPNGFIREGEDRYEELIELSHGNTSKFPEISKTSLLISFSDDRTKEIAVKKLKELRWQIQSLADLI